MEQTKGVGTHMKLSVRLFSVSLEEEKRTAEFWAPIFKTPLIRKTIHQGDNLRKYLERRKGSLLKSETYKLVFIQTLSSDYPILKRLILENNF